MAFYVYIIRSLMDGSYYKGFSENPAKRLLQHNNQESSYTANKIPWSLVYVEECLTKTDALKRERMLKKATNERLEALLKHPKNILPNFIKR